jgi:hypothetical protein
MMLDMGKVGKILGSDCVCELLMTSTSIYKQLNKIIDVNTSQTQNLRKQ